MHALVMAAAILLRGAPAVGALRITSIPSGAVVLIDGFAAGVTTDDAPLIVRCPPGRRELRLTRPGFLDLTASVVVRPGRTLPAKACLRPVWYVASKQGGRLRPGFSVRATVNPFGKTPGEAQARFMIREPAGTPLVLTWDRHPFAAVVEVWSGDRILSKSLPSAVHHEYEFTMPEDPLQVVVRATPVDRKKLGITRFHLSLDWNACPLVAEGGRARRAPSGR